MTVVFLTPGEPEAQAVWEPTPLHTQTLLVEVPTFGAPDADGVPSRSSVWFTWRQCNVQLTASGERVDGGAMSATTRWRASGPIEERITSSCVITWRGRSLTVEGEPAHFRGGALDHTEVVLVEKRG